MKIVIYRNIDRPFSLFGIKGMFVMVFMSLAVISVLLSLLIGAMTYTIVGLVFLLVVLFALYLGISIVQGRYREKDILRMINSLRMPSFIITRHKVWRQ